MVTVEITSTHNTGVLFEIAYHMSHWNLQLFDTLKNTHNLHTIRITAAYHQYC